MTKGAFNKIKAGMRRYLDGSADKREFRVRELELADAKINSTSVEAQARPPEKAT